MRVPFKRGDRVRFKADAMTHAGKEATVEFCRVSLVRPGSGLFRMRVRLHDGIGTQVGCMSDQFDPVPIEWDQRAGRFVG